MKRAAVVILLTATSGLGGWWLGLRHGGAPVSTGSVGQSPPAGTVSEPESPLEGSFAGTGRLDPLGLLSLKPEEYPARLRQAFREGWEHQTKWLAEHWAERDPVSLLAFMLAPDGLNFTPGSTWPDYAVTQACFGAWLRKNPAAAVGAMEKLVRFSNDNGEVSRSVWSVILPKFLEVDLAGALRFLARHPEFTSPGMLLGDSGPIAEALVSMPECGSRESLLKQAFWKLSKGFDSEKGQAESLEWLGKLSPAARLEAIPSIGDLDSKQLPRLKAMLSQAFTAEELSALDQGMKGRPDLRKTKVMASLRALLDPKAAVSWADSILTGKAQFEALSSILDLSVPGSLAGALPFVDSFPEGPLRDRAFNAVVQRGGESGTRREVADWVLGLANAREVKAGISSLMGGGWAEYDSTDCASWLSQLPSGSRRAECAQAALMAVRDPVKKLNLAASLPADLGVAALDEAFRSGGSSSDSRPLAEAAALQPAGAVRELAMARASADARYFFNGFTQSWLDWAAALPTAADRAAALRGAEDLQGRARWDEGTKEAAKAKLGDVVP